MGNYLSFYVPGENNVVSKRINGLGFSIGVDNDFLIDCGQKMTWFCVGIEIKFV